VTDEPEDIADGTATLLQCIEQLEKQLARATKGNCGVKWVSQLTVQLTELGATGP